MAYVSIPSYSRSIPQRYALVGTKCKSCGAVSFPATLSCLQCGGSEFQPLKLSGRGTIYCYTTVSRGGAPPEFSTQQNLVGAYHVAVVELKEGPKIVAQLTNCKGEELKIGLPVEATFRRIYEDDGMVRYGVKFMPARTTGP